MKGDAGVPLGPALTLTIKEQTISVKHVFSAFTLYANVLRRVKVPFDEAQQEFIRETIHWNLAKKKTQTLLSSFSRWKDDFQGALQAKLCFPRAGSCKSICGFFFFLFSLVVKTQGIDVRIRSHCRS